MRSRVVAEERRDWRASDRVYARISANPRSLRGVDGHGDRTVRRRGQCSELIAELRSHAHAGEVDRADRRSVVCSSAGRERGTQEVREQGQRRVVDAVVPDVQRGERRAAAEDDEQLAETVVVQETVVKRERRQGATVPQRGQRGDEGSVDAGGKRRKKKLYFVSSRMSF